MIQDGAIQGSGEGESAGDEPAKETRTATGGNRDQVMLSVINVIITVSATYYKDHWGSTKK